jgi:hypothetical protein
VSAPTGITVAAIHERHSRELNASTNSALSNNLFDRNTRQLFKRVMILYSKKK